LIIGVLSIAGLAGAALAMGVAGASQLRATADDAPIGETAGRPPVGIELARALDLHPASDNPTEDECYHVVGGPEPGFYCLSRTPYRDAATLVDAWIVGRLLYGEVPASDEIARIRNDPSLDSVEFSDGPEDPLVAGYRTIAEPLRLQAAESMPANPSELAP
jgi:hypothetical protein